MKVIPNIYSQQKKDPYILRCGKGTIENKNECVPEDPLNHSFFTNKNFNLDNREIFDMMYQQNCSYTSQGIVCHNIENMDEFLQANGRSYCIGDGDMNNPRRNENITIVENSSGNSFYCRLTNHELRDDATKNTYDSEHFEYIGYGLLETDSELLASELKCAKNEHNEYFTCLMPNLNAIRIP